MHKPNSFNFPSFTLKKKQIFLFPVVFQVLSLVVIRRPLWRFPTAPRQERSLRTHFRFRLLIQIDELGCSSALRHTSGPVRGGSFVFHFSSEESGVAALIALSVWRSGIFEGDAQTPTPKVTVKLLCVCLRCIPGKIQNMYFINYFCLL